MALTGQVSVPFNVAIKMASALPANAIHTVVFSGPLSGPHELQINSGGTLVFNDANWNVNQNVNVTPLREGTVNLNYSISSPYTRIPKTGSIALTIAQPSDQFVQDGTFWGSAGGELSTVIYQEIGYYDATVGSGTLQLSPGATAFADTIYRRNPSGTLSVFTQGVPVSIPEIGHHRFFAVNGRGITSASDPTKTLTATDSAGVNIYNYTRIRGVQRGGSPTISAAASFDVPPFASYFSYSVAGGTITADLEGCHIVPNTPLTFTGPSGGAFPHVRNIVHTAIGSDLTLQFNYAGEVEFGGAGQVKSTVASSIAACRYRVVVANPVTEPIPSNGTQTALIPAGGGGTGFGITLTSF